MVHLVPLLLVIVNGILLKPVPLIYGESQGNVLEPDLFMLYTTLYPLHIIASMASPIIFMLMIPIYTLASPKHCVLQSHCIAAMCISCSVLNDKIDSSWTPLKRNFYWLGHQRNVPLWHNIFVLTFSTHQCPYVIQLNTLVFCLMPVSHFPTKSSCFTFVNHISSLLCQHWNPV